MTRFLIFLIGLLLPASRPCLNIMAPREETPRTVARQGPLPVSSLTACLQSLPALEGKIKFANFFLHSPLISEFLTLNSELKSFLPHLPYFLGQNKPTSYLILLGNDREMRANGGFFGSYAKIIIPRTPRRILGEGGASTLEGEDNTKPKIFSPEISFQDIYVPDGAIPGHVEPPAPIQTAFKQGWFRLRDADWEPDFQRTATAIRWFFEKGNEINPDVLVTLNLTTIEKMAKIIEEVDVPEYGFKLNADNLYTLLQNQAEIDAFPGSTQKKDVLSAAGRAIIKKLSHLEFVKLVKLAQILLDQLNHGNLLVNSANPEIQKIILSKNWGGQIPNIKCQISNCLTDTVMLVETNLGANKANCCVDRKTIHTISHTPYAISHLVNLTFTNNSPLENPLPPRFYGGNYISYLRFYLPPNATRIRLTAQPTLPKTLTQYPIPFDGINQKTFDLKDNYDLREVGFFHLTAAGTSSHVQLSYDLPFRSLGEGGPESNYQLNLLKQHGLESSPQEINLFGKTSSTKLDSDFSISANLTN